MARKNRTQIWLEYAAARGVLGFLGLLPRSAAVRLGLAASRLAFRMLGGLRRVAARNLALAMPELSEKDRDRIIKGSFENLGRLLGEMSHFHKLTPERIGQMIDFEIDPAVLERYRR